MKSSRRECRARSSRSGPARVTSERSPRSATCSTHCVDRVATHHRCACRCDRAPRAGGVQLQLSEGGPLDDLDHSNRDVGRDLDHHRGPWRRCVLGPGFAPGTAVHQMTVDGEARELLVHIPPDPAPGMRTGRRLPRRGRRTCSSRISTPTSTRLADKQGFVVATPNGIDAAIRQWRFLNSEGHRLREGNRGESRAQRLRRPAARVHDGHLERRRDDHLARVPRVPTSSPASHRSRPSSITPGTAAPRSRGRSSSSTEPPTRSCPTPGGKVGTNSGLSVRNTEATAAQWAQHNRCTSGPVTTHLGSEVTRLSWNVCKAPVGVVPDRRRRTHVARGNHRHPTARSHDAPDQGQRHDVEVVHSVRLIQVRGAARRRG